MTIFQPTARKLALQHKYIVVYEILWRMAYGAGLRGEIARMLGQSSPELDEEKWLAGLREESRELENFVPKSLVDEDWAARRRTEISDGFKSTSEAKLLDQLIKANAPRTVRKIVNQSRWLRGSELGLFLKEQPERFVNIKSSERFPKSTDNRIDFLAKSIGASLSGYESSTGRRYLAKVSMCEQCGKRLAVVELIRNGVMSPWCGAC